MNTPGLAADLGKSSGKAASARNVAPVHTIRARAVAGRRVGDPGIVGRPAQHAAAPEGSPLSHFAICVTLARRPGTKPRTCSIVR